MRRRRPLSKGIGAGVRQGAVHRDERGILARRRGVKPGGLTTGQAPQTQRDPVSRAEALRTVVPLMTGRTAFDDGAGGCCVWVEGQGRQATSRLIRP